MNDAEREELAVWKFGEAGYRVTRQAGLYFVWYGDTETARMDNLAALVELAEAIYAAHWTGRKITPTA
jgi:hypothetical protein